ncbi:MAG: acyl-CoA dehydrogenase family protein [Dehalococcoidia bacterium]|nr:acyl-CoA dehydrogenase family protein [Dehalococcoidia bacterium]
MQFRDTGEESAFRSEVRSFIQGNLPGNIVAINQNRVMDPEQQTAFESWKGALSQRGWFAPHWPKEYGGAGMSVVEHFVFNEEMAEARAPQVGGMGVQMIGPIIIRFGNDEQKAEHLPKITSGEVTWCQGYSEPGSGSDLASLQARAVRDGDEYVVNGQKIWTTGAHRANWMFMLARTDPDAPKHRGISMLLVDMKSEGLDVQPLITMSGEHVFNQEFFTDVRVPVKNRIGEENRGWYIGAALLDFERSNIATAIGLKHSVMDLVTIARGLKPGAVPRHDREQVRNQVVERLVEASVARLVSYRVIDIQRRGGIPNYEASMNKLFGSEAGQRVAATGVKLLGMYGGLVEGSKHAANGGRITLSYLATLASTIAAGTSEVNRSVIATRGLGLPRS